MSRTTPGDRVRHLLEMHWNANQSAMARDTKCAQSTLSLVASEANEPGKRLLTLIAAHPDVNAKWLFHGKGKSLVNPSAKLVPQQESSSLPIVSELLEHFPSDCKNLAVDERLDVAPQLANKGAYFYRVPFADPILWHEEMGIHTGDLLLIDMTEGSIPPKENLYCKLCVVRHPKHQDRVCLGQVSYIEASEDDGPEKIEVDTFDIGYKASEIIYKKKKVKFRKKEIVTMQYYIYSGEGEEKRLEQISHLELEPPLLKINYKDILGVCKRLVRKDI